MVKPIGLRLRDIAEDDELEGVVTRLEPYGAFVNINSERDGLVHISQIAHDYVKHPEEALSVGETVTVKVLKVNRKKRQVDLSIKALIEPPLVESVVEVPRSAAVKGEAEEIIEEAIPTAMALAFATIQNKDQEDSHPEDDATPSNKSKKQKELDEIIARTLATSE
jgi:predicted RNA-binding protein with RPS1 domain